MMNLNKIFTQLAISCLKIDTANLAGVAFCLLDQLDSACITIDATTPSKLSKILDELSSGGHLNGFSKHYIFVSEDSIQVQAQQEAGFPRQSGSMGTA